MEELIDNPKKWYEPYQEPKEDELIGGWNKDKENSRSNTLSASYVDGTLLGYDKSLAHGDKERPKSIIYGFDHIRPTTLIYAKKRDGQIPNYIKQSGGYSRGIQTLPNNIDELSPATRNEGYNEVAMFRYDEKRRAIEPSFIITDQSEVLLDTESKPEEEIRALGDKQHITKTHNFYMNRIKQHALEHGVPIILIDRNAYGSTSEEDVPTDEYINRHYLSMLSAGANPEFAKSKLSAEESWSNYDTFKKYIPDLDINTEFDSLVNTRSEQKIAKLEGYHSVEDQKQAYTDVVFDAITGPDVYTFLDRGGSKAQLTEMANRTGDADAINYIQQLLSSMG